MPDAKSKPKKKPSNPFISEDSEACCKHFAPLVEDIPVEELDPWNTDAEILRVNVVGGWTPSARTRPT